MPTIIPLPTASCNHVPLDVSESSVEQGNEVVDSGPVKKIEQNVMDDFVNFLLTKGDKDEISNFQHALSDYSRHKGHIFDSQLERIDKWQSREKFRYEEMCDTFLTKLQEQNICVQGDYYNIHDNKIEN